jgi:hypothetical protein
MTCDWCRENKELTHICIVCDAKFCCEREVELHFIALNGSDIFKYPVIKKIQKEDTKDAKHK